MAPPFIVLGRTVHPRYYLPVALLLPRVRPYLYRKSGNVCANLDRPKCNWCFVTRAQLCDRFLAVYAAELLYPQIRRRSCWPIALNTLTEWSSARHSRSHRYDATGCRRGKRLTVVTEGSFGTLPALLMEFDARPEIRWLRIEGLAQYPVKTIPDCLGRSC